MYEKKNNLIIYYHPFKTIDPIFDLNSMTKITSATAFPGID